MGHAPSSWLLVTLCSPSLLTFLAPPACLLCFSSFPFPVALNSCSLYCGVVSLGFTWRTKWSGGICWSAGCFSCQAQRRGANASSQRVKKGGSAASRGETAERSRERQGKEARAAEGGRSKTAVRGVLEFGGRCSSTYNGACRGWAGAELWAALPLSRHVSTRNTRRGSREEGSKGEGRHAPGELARRARGWGG